LYQNTSAYFVSTVNYGHKQFIALATFASILGGKEAWGYLVEFHVGAKRPIRSLLLGFYALKPPKI
jgi:hypothetical protein